MKFEVEARANKFIEVEAEDEEEAIQKVREMPLDINDFAWDFQADEV